MKLALGPAAVVTCNAAFDVIERGVVHCKDGRITWVGAADDAPPFEADEVIGGEHLVVLPGLVNVHTHAAMTLLRGYADDMELKAWLEERIWPYERHLTPADIETGTALAALEMLQGGTTCVADMYFNYRGGTRVLVEAGMRAAPAAVLLGFLPEPERRLAEGIAFVREHAGSDGLVTPLLSPHSLYTCTREQWEAVVQAAHDTGAGIHTHAAETRSEVAEVTAAWGAPPIEVLHELGATSAGLLVAHAVHTTEAERDIMAREGVRVAHNPQSNLKLASGIAPVADYLARGIAVGLGPDGPASNNNLDLWEEMRLAATLHKATTGDPTAVTARQALEMATIGGARCLGLEARIGSIEVGKRADVAVVDFDRPHLVPRHNVVSNLVYAAGAEDVVATVVDGRVLYRNGEWRTVDRERVMVEVRKVVGRLGT